MIQPAQIEPDKQAAIVPKPDSTAAMQAPGVFIRPINGQFSAAIV